MRILILFTTLFCLTQTALSQTADDAIVISDATSQYWPVAADDGTIKFKNKTPTTYLAERMGGVEVKVVILGYIQRGGSPTARDRILASRTGVRCVELIREGVSNAAIGIKGDTIVDYPLSVALAMEKDSHLEYQRICDILL